MEKRFLKYLNHHHLIKSIDTSVSMEILFFLPDFFSEMYSFLLAKKLYSQNVLVLLICEYVVKVNM